MENCVNTSVQEIYGSGCLYSDLAFMKNISQSNTIIGLAAMLNYGKCQLSLDAELYEVVQCGIIHH